jgi:hypothetical protein
VIAVIDTKEEVAMDKGSEHDRLQHEEEVDREDAIRRSLDEEGKDATFNPRTGEDPGLLELTEDPLERRQKRNTM